MKYIMIGIVKLYRKFISPLKPPCCRFTPTCSQYALEAFTKRGFFVGFILTVWRILRCNPFCRAGYDPVPTRGLRNKHKAGEEMPKDIAELPLVLGDAKERSEEAEVLPTDGTELDGEDKGDAPRDEARISVSPKEDAANSSDTHKD